MELSRREGATLFARAPFRAFYYDANDERVLRYRFEQDTDELISPGDARWGMRAGGAIWNPTLRDERGQVLVDRRQGDGIQGGFHMPLAATEGRQAQVRQAFLQVAQILAAESDVGRQVAGVAGMGGIGKRRFPALQQGLPAGDDTVAQARQLVLKFGEGSQDAGQRLSRMLDSLDAQGDTKMKEI